MFEAWHDFYLMIGGSSTGLIGLLFVVVTLSAASEATTGMGDLTRGHSVYATPTVFHLGVVLLVSTIALTPDPAAPLCGAIFFASAMLGLLYARWVIMQFRSRAQPPGFETLDLWLYGVAPAMFYIALSVVSVLIAIGASWGVRLLAVVIIGLLLLAIYNAWDIAGWLAHPSRKEKRSRK